MTAGDELVQEEYCDWCELYGHTFRTCPRRDDELEELEP